MTAPSVWLVVCIGGVGSRKELLRLLLEKDETLHHSRLEPSANKIFLAMPLR